MSSSASETDSDESERSFDGGLTLEEDDDDVDNLIHPLLQKDIELFKQHYPSETIICRRLDYIHEIDIKLTMNLNFIKRVILDAWGVSQDLPLIIKLNLNTDLYYIEKNCVKVHVFQDVDTRQSSALIQLQNTAKTFCEEWFELQIKSKTEKCTSLEERNGEDVRESYKTEENGESNTEGFLCKLHSYIQQKLQTLNEYCPICDKHHGVTCMLKPTVCSDRLCIFSYQTLGVMCQVTDLLDTQREVLDLLLSFTKDAVSSSRHDLILHPFPDVNDSSSLEFIFSKDEEGLKLLRKVMAVLATVTFPQTSSESELKELLSSYHKYCYPLLRWIVSSNRSHVVYLPKEKQIDFMKTSYQFVMRNSPPKEEAHFRALVKQHGSCFAFHGSPSENWHSIIRQGLIVASGTELQLHGAAGGIGIYATPSLGRALSYAGHVATNRASDTQSGDKTMRLSSLCVALCEVVIGSDKKKGPDKWVIQNSQHICTRFFFLYRGTSQSYRFSLNDVCSTSDHFVESIKTVLSDI